MRAIIYFSKDKYINIAGDSIDTDCGWIKVYNGDRLVAIFGEEIVDCAYISEKKEDKK